MRFSAFETYFAVKSDKLFILGTHNTSLHINKYVSMNTGNNAAKFGKSE